MMKWREFIDHLIDMTHKLKYGRLELSLDGGISTTGIPPIIKSSMMMLDKMQQNQGRLNIFVFPERIQSIFIFTIVKLLHNISTGRIDGAYNPEEFTLGEHLRIGDAVVEFLGFEVYKDMNCMKIRLSDANVIARPENFPFFQRTDAKRLNTYRKYEAAVNEVKRQFRSRSVQDYFLYILNNFKTHMDKSIFYMTSITHTKELIKACSLSGRAFSDLVLIGQADFEGNVRNIGTGQLGGKPAIVLASDLYAVSSAASNGNDIQSIIIDASNGNTLMTQMDALDELIRLGVPVTCVTDVVNSFDLEPFQKRGFNIWRWDRNTISEQLYNAASLNSDRKIKNCAMRKLDYYIAEGSEIGTAIRLLYTHRKETTESSTHMIKIFELLFSLAFTALWETVPFDDEQLLQAEKMVHDCSGLLKNEKKYISQKMYEDYSSIISCIQHIYDKDFVLLKNTMLAQFLATKQPSSVALVVSERCNKDRVQTYWDEWCRNYAPGTEIQTFYPSEYYLLPGDMFSITVVVGWLKRAIMKKILFSYNTESYIVLLYDYEKRWKNYTASKWNSSLNSSQNLTAIQKSFTTEDVEISTENFISSVVRDEEATSSDEYAEIELTLRENKYRQYTLTEGQRSVCETADAVPVNYVGGYLAFYKVSHKIIVASNIIEHDEEKIETKLPGDLRICDFVVVRVSDQDLVMEMADVLLEKEGRKEQRALASLWKESLAKASVFHSHDEIYKKLCAAGSTRNYQTVRTWITDKDMIAPQSRIDLEHIAKATECGVLQEKIDQVYNASQLVKAKHIQAGKELSILLKKKVVAALKEHGDVDPFNIWAPIEMHVEDVGPVRILKVIDIGAPVIVDAANTNPLIEE